MAAVEPFHLSVPQSDLDELKRRLAAVRLPEAETLDGWDQGVPLERLRALIDYWASDYDWRRCEAMLNALGQHKTVIDGLGVHFLHIRSPHESALPLILTHGWPGSVVEFHKVIGPLTDPEAHGGSAADAFHLVIPSLPGYGFSDRPARAGWGVERIAAAWAELMARLGYDHYVAQGGDWGSIVTVRLAALRPPGLAGIHLNMLLAMPKSFDGPLDAEEQRAVAMLEHYYKVESGYAIEQSTRPQTLGYALADSPSGQAAWIYEKFQRWSDCGGDPENIFSRDELLDNIMLYWLPNCGASSARLYWESMATGGRPIPLDLPVGCSVFPKEIVIPPRKWAERLYPNLIHWNELDRGGHFAALEQPALFVEEVRTCFRRLR